MKKVKQLMDKKVEQATAATAVKQLLSGAMSKSGKVKAIKLKVKFGGGEKSTSDKPKRKVNSGPASGPGGM